MHHPQETSRNSVAQAAADILARVRARAPRIHCITNAVAQNFTGNMLLAAGCVPSMTLSPEETSPFVASAQGLLVNLGTFDRERRQATMIAIESAAVHKLPWVLDPVFVDRTPPRATFARELIGRRPTVLRLNHAEFSTLSAEPPSGDAAKAFAGTNRIVVALSGETDLVTDGERMTAVSNGHPLMAKVTAMGCAGSALVAGCLSIEPDAFQATSAALLIIGVAGEIAAEKSAGPGSFAAAIIDTLYGLDSAALAARAKVS
ncbi:MAG: hydroxyethylthiazole kinase [Pseudolabrys sp.]